MSERIDTLDEDQEFIAPDNGGWHYTIMRDWIAVCPDIGPTAARLYWIIRSIMHEKGERARRLSYDQLCYLLPGVNGKPTGETRVKDALRELEGVGLLSNPDGDVVRRWVTDPKTGKQRKDNFRRWKIHDYPTHDYAGWRSAIAKLDAYTEDWRQRLSAEGRNSASQSSSKPIPSNNNPSSQRSTEGRNSDPSRRNSDPPRRNSGDGKPIPSNNATTKNPSKESPQPTKGTRPVDNSEVVGWLGATPNGEDEAGQRDGADPTSHANQAPGTEGRKLLLEWGVTGSPLDEWARVVDDGIAVLGRQETQTALSGNLGGVHSAAGVIVARRLPALRDRLAATRQPHEDDGSPKKASELPVLWCRECTGIPLKADGGGSKRRCSPECSTPRELPEWIWQHITEGTASADEPTDDQPGSGFEQRRGLRFVRPSERADAASA